MVEPRQAGPEAVDTATSPQPYRPGGGGSSPPRGGGRGRARVGGWGGGMSKCMPPPRRLPGNDRTAAAWQGPLMESGPASTRSGRAIRPPLTMG